MLKETKTLWGLMRGERIHYGAAIAVLTAGTLIGYLVPMVGRAAINSVDRGWGGERADYVSRAFGWLGLEATMANHLWIAAAAMILFTAASGALSEAGAEALTALALEGLDGWSLACDPLPGPEGAPQ